MSLKVDSYFVRLSYRKSVSAQLILPPISSYLFVVVICMRTRSLL